MDDDEEKKKREKKHTASELFLASFRKKDECKQHLFDWAQEKTNTGPRGAYKVYDKSFCKAVEEVLRAAAISKENGERVHGEHLIHLRLPSLKNIKQRYRLNADDNLQHWTKETCKDMIVLEDIPLRARQMAEEEKCENVDALYKAMSNKYYGVTKECLQKLVIAPLSASTCDSRPRTQPEDLHGDEESPQVQEEEEVEDGATGLLDTLKQPQDGEEGEEEMSFQGFGGDDEEEVEDNAVGFLDTPEQPQDGEEEEEEEEEETGRQGFRGDKARTHFKSPLLGVKQGVKQQQRINHVDDDKNFETFCIDVLAKHEVFFHDVSSRSNVPP